MEDWDIISPKDVIGLEQLLPERTRTLASAALPLTQSLLTQVQLLSLPIQSGCVLNVVCVLCVVCVRSPLCYHIRFNLTVITQSTSSGTPSCGLHPTRRAKH